MRPLAPSRATPYAGNARQTDERAGKMRLLITNDDGINAPGLITLEAIAKDLAGPDGEVWVVAPAFEQSGVGHCISYTHPMMVAKLGERRVRLGLLLAALGRKNEIEVSDAEFTQAIMNQARQYPGQERQFFEFVQQNQQMQQQLRAPIFEDKVVDHIAEQATVTEKEISKDELQTAVDALEEE